MGTLVRGAVVVGLAALGLVASLLGGADVVSAPAAVALEQGRAGREPTWVAGAAEDGLRESVVIAAMTQRTRPPKRGFAEYYHRADLDQSGVLDAGDIYMFQEWWLAQRNDADLDFNGSVDAADLAAFVREFLYGEWSDIIAC